MTNLSAETIQVTNNKSIAFSDEGKGRALVLIHAFPTDQTLWEPQVQTLKKHFRVITMDLLGFGKSAPVDGQAITMTEYADEVNEVLKHLHIDKAIVGGESMGGYISLAFLDKYPEKLQGLILSNTQAIADTAEAKEKREKTAVDVLQNGTKNLIDGFMPKALSPNADEQTKSTLRNILDAQSATAMASALRGMALRKDTTELLTHASLPILIITSDQDIVVPPQQSLNMHEQAKNSKLVTIKNAGHLSSLEQAKDWNQAVIDMYDKR